MHVDSAKNPGDRLHPVRVPRGARLGALACLAIVCALTPSPTVAQDLPSSTLPLELLGVAVDSRTPSRSGCLVRCTYPVELRRTSIVQVGQTACDTAEVLEVHEDAVVVRNMLTNRAELLTFRGAGRVTGVASTHTADPTAPKAVTASPEDVSVELPSGAVEQYVANLPELLSSALATPHYVEGGGGPGSIDGFEISQIKPGSVVEKLGIKDGDVIQAVNGERLDSVATVMRLFGQAQATTEATLTVLRNGQRMTFTFRTR